MRLEDAKKHPIRPGPSTPPPASAAPVRTTSSVVSPSAAGPDGAASSSACPDNAAGASAGSATGPAGAASSSASPDSAAGPDDAALSSVSAGSAVADGAGPSAAAPGSASPGSVGPGAASASAGGSGLAADLLAGVRVLDLTNVLAGPFAGYQLGLMGADVVKVEVPSGGDLARNLGADPELSARGLGISFLAQNGGKRSLTLDLKKPAGREVFERLVRDADVLLENFRPGVLDRLGFGWDVLHELNEGLVYCAVSGFGQTGPMRGRPAYDQIIQGLSGIMSVTGTPETSPTRTGFPIADTLGGYAAAFAISAALVKRSRTGAGSYLDVSMLETAVAAMGWVVSDYLIGGREPRAMGNENATSAPSGTFATADGALNIAANKQEQYVELCTVLGRPELIADPRFATRESRKQHRSALKAELEKTLGERSAADWDDLLSTTGVPVAPVLTVPQALALAQLTERQLLHEVPMPPAEDMGEPSTPGSAAPGEVVRESAMPERRSRESGERSLRVLGSSVQVDGRAVGPAGRPPGLGEHVDEVLGGLGYSVEEIADLRAEGVV